MNRNLLFMMFLQSSGEDDDDLTQIMLSPFNGSWWKLWTFYGILEGFGSIWTLEFAGFIHGEFDGFSNANINCYFPSLLIYH